MTNEPDAGRGADALTDALRALDEQVARGGEDSAEVALRSLDVAFALSALGEHESSLDYRRRALAVRERVLGERHPDIALALNHVGHALVELGRPGEALDVHARALEILREDPATEGATLARAHYSLAAPLVQLGHYERARRHLRMAQDFARKNLGPLHALTLDARRMLKVVGRAAGAKGAPTARKSKRRTKRRR